MTVSTSMMASLRLDLQSDEGTRYNVYKDTRGNPTVGIGHKVTAKDKLKIGDKITKTQAYEFFENDIARSIIAARKAVKNFDEYPEESIAAWHQRLGLEC